MAKSATNIREDLFQKQHAESMQALIWALALLKQNKGRLSSKEKYAIQDLKKTHAKTFEDEPALGEAFEVITENTHRYSEAAVQKAIQKLRTQEKAYLEDLERKSTRHKLSLFFAFFFAVGCGTTVAGANFFVGADYGLTGHALFLATLAAVSLPIIACVALANWWMVVRAIANIENANEDPYTKVREFMKKRLGNKYGEYAWYNAWLYALGIVFYEIWNALAFNFKQTEKEKEEEKEAAAKRTPLQQTLEKITRWGYRFFVFFAAVIYAFFAYAATYKLGMAIYELFYPNAMVNGGLAQASTWGPAVFTSAAAGIFMAIPTYMAMKTLYIRASMDWFDKVKGSKAIIEKIPGAKSSNRWWLGKPLYWWFKVAATAIVISIAFATYAATAPLNAFFMGMGLASNIAGPLSIATVATAFIGNIPFFWHCAASTFAQHFDPRTRLNSTNSKLFPYVRFWNAVLNSIPVLLGVLAVFGVLGVAALGPFAPLVMLAPVIINVVVGAVASYGANCGGSKTMYQFDAAKQISKYQLAQLEAMNCNMNVMPPKELTPDDQLCAEYFGAYQYMLEGKVTPQMPALATALRNVVLNDTTKHLVTVVQKELIYRSMTESTLSKAWRGVARFSSSIFHGNIRYVKNLFPNDYLVRIETHASEEAKDRLYEAALEGGGTKTQEYRDLLSSPKSVATLPKLTGSQADLFWKAYSVKNVTVQQAVMTKLLESNLYNADIQHLLMENSKPVLRTALFVKSGGSISKIDQDQASFQLFYQQNRFAIKYPATQAFLQYMRFPGILISDLMGGVFSGIKQLFGVNNGPAKAIDPYTFLTEQADDATRKNYLSEVLRGYIAKLKEGTAEKNVAQKLLSTLAGNRNMQFSTEEFGILTSGVIGEVFDIAAGIPEVKVNMKCVLDKAVEKEQLGAEVEVSNSSDTVSYQSNSTSSSPTSASTASMNLNQWNGVSSSLPTNNPFNQCIVTSRSEMVGM